MYAAIFDFNGTLFLDSDKHNAAWHLFVDRYHKHVTEEEFRAHFLGCTNSSILRRMFGNDMPEAEIERMTLEKEGLYRELCMADRPNFHLVAGAEAFLDYLKAQHVNFTIATGSEISNVRFYFEKFGLDRWFRFERVVYDDGSYPGKPAPDGYLRAAAVLGVDPKDCVVFEDSLSGIRAANAAGIGRIAAILSTTPAAELRAFPNVLSATTDFTSMIDIWEKMQSC